MSTWIGLREARKEIGPLADRAHLAGEIAYLTRHGKPIAAVVPLDRIKEPSMPRNVISTNAYIEVTEAYSDKVREILDAPGGVIRDTYRRNEHGQIDYFTRIVSYDVGDGTRWAVDYFDPASREVEEFDDLHEAEARYEEMVRASAGDLGINQDDEQETFDETDVPGVPGYNA